MVRCILLSAATAALLIGPQSPAGGADKMPVEPLVLQPSSDWNLDYAADKCRLARAFGTGENQTIFFIERYNPGDGFFALVAGAPLAKFDAARAQLRFGPDGFQTKNPPMDGRLDDKPALMTGMTLYPLIASEEAPPPVGGDAPGAQTGDRFAQAIPAEFEGKITWFEASARGQRPLRLALGSMGKPMAALRTCTEELVEHWGIDVTAHRTLTRAVIPKGNPGRWMTADDYPTELIEKGAQGVVQFRLIVGADGKPTQCAIQESTRPKGFDDAVCAAMMRRARFDPALDKDGNPITSYWRTSVRFMMP
jgi:TonB family protein